MSDALVSLEQAHTHLSAAQLEPGLAAMRRAWAQVRAPALGEAIEKLAGLLATSRPPLRGATLVENDADWHSRVDDPAELGLLLPCIAEIDSHRARQRLRRLSAHAPDPLLATHLSQLLLDPPYTSSSAGKFWTTLFELLCACADPRALARLEAGEVRVQQTIVGRRLQRLRERVIASMRSRLEVIPTALDPPARARLGQIEALLERQLDAPPATAAELLAAIHAEPHDLCHRQVYSDYLLAIGDPRGEFIVLQLSDARGELDRDGRRRMRELLAEHGRGWLGEIGWGLVRGSLVFERGFLVAAAVKRHSRRRGALAGDPVWATVESVDNAPLDVLVNPVMRALKRIGCDTPEVAALLASGSTFAGVERLQITLVNSWHPSLVTSEAGFSHTLRRALERSDPFPSLTELTLVTQIRLGVDQLQWIWTGPLGRRLHTLALRGTSEALPSPAALLPGLRRASASLDRLALTTDGQVHWRLCRDSGEGRRPWSLIELELGRAHPSVSAELAELAELVDIELSLAGPGAATLELSSNVRALLRT